MGRLQAEEMVSQLSQDQALRWHLQYNHYPPISLDFIPTAKKAIKKANQEECGYIIKMPNGRILPVSEIIEGLHLESFLDEEVLE